MQFRSKQRGGTILGLLVGLTIGVGVAVALAFWFGKQSPVVNRMQPKGSLSEAEEKEKNKTWDPNAGLFGKTVPPSLQTLAANGTAAASAALSEANPSDSTARAVDAKPLVPAIVGSAAIAAPAKPKPAASSTSASADPLGDMLKARAKAKAASAAAAAAVPTGTPTQSAANSTKTAFKPEPRALGASTVSEGGVYFVQVGAFKTPEDANAQKAKLALLGIETKVTEREQAGKTVYRVRAGVFKKIDEAESMKSRLDKAGFEAVLVKTPI
jgi:cell division protein FtsN